MTDSDSEFGRGIVVCLAKFSEHLHQHGPYSEQAIQALARWRDMSDLDRKRIVEEANKYPNGDSAQFILRMEILMGKKDRTDTQVIDDAISRSIEYWMNAASDHFYELDENAPQPLKDLASLALQMGHGFTGNTWTYEDVKTIRRLWKEACLAVDEMLGVEDSEWGNW